MVLDFVYPAPQCGEDDTRPAIVANVHYTYYGQLIITITILVMVIASLLTEPVEEEEVQINEPTIKEGAPTLYIFPKFLKNFKKLKKLVLSRSMSEKFLCRSANGIFCNQRYTK